MSWVTVLWSMIAAASLTMALPHLVIWLKLRGRDAWVNLLFVVAALAVAAIAGWELMVMKAQTTEQIGRVMRWAHVPVFVLLVAIVGFVRLYFGTGRMWLGVAAVATRLVSLVLNFLMEPNLTHREITGLRKFSFLGELIAMPEGVGNPWRRLGELSSLLLLIFVVDASLALWRRGGPEDRQRAVVVGGSIAVFVLVAAGTSALINAGVIQAPYLISFPFLAIIGAMAFEVGHDVLRSEQVARNFRASEMARREGEERMSLAVEAANLGIWIWEVPGEKIWATDNLLALFAIPAGTELRPQTLQDHVHPDDRAARQQAIERAVHERQPYDAEFRVLLPDGGVRWIASHGRAEFDTSARPIRLLGVCRDISAWKQAELEARRHREELAHLGRVALLGEMAGGLAHEINQPLTGIVNNASAGRRFIAKGRGDALKLDSLFEAIVADGCRAGEIIRGIREMVHKGEEVRKPVNLNDVIGEVLRFVRADARGRHCALLTELDPELPSTSADPVRLQQVVLNLVVNAFDAMRETPVERRRVILRTERVTGDRVRLSVRDFGSGLPLEAPERIFEQFFSTKREGLGMGLAIARSIITAHGGELTAANAEGGGACFYFSLPENLESREETEPQTHGEPVAAL